VITRQLQAAEVLSKLSTMNDKSSFVKVPVVIIKQLKLYFNNTSRMPTLVWFLIAKVFCQVHENYFHDKSVKDTDFMSAVLFSKCYSTGTL
jgi:hypothetical protein